MPQSHANVLLRVIFSTKNRAPFLTDKKLRDELNASMVGTLQARLRPSLIVRCLEDHLHALVRLSRTMTIAQLAETMKVESSALVSGRTPGAVGSSWYRIR